MSSARKPGKALEIRRERNRNSQRASRQKQANYIRELEERLQGVEIPSDDRNAQLQTENSDLRKQLLAVHKKLESVQATLKALSEVTTHVLGSKKSPDDVFAEVETPHGTLTSTPSLRHDSSPDVLSELGPQRVLLTDRHGGSLPASSESSLGSGPAMSNMTVPATALPVDGGLFSSALPYAMELTNRMAPINYGMTLPPTVQSQSNLSNHLSAIRCFLEPQIMALAGDQTSIATLTTFLFSAFVACAWPGMTTFFTYTGAHKDLSRILHWMACPTDGSFSSLLARHSPTQLQMDLAHSYPCAIDIMPFPSMRDKLIVHHASDPNLDELICEIAEAFVVEVDLAKIVLGLPSGPGIIGAWDLARAIDDSAGPACDMQQIVSCANEMTFGNADEGFVAGDLDSHWAPASSVQELFGSAQKSREAFFALGLHQGAVRYKLDPVLFLRHPHLLDVDNDLRAVGTRIKPRHQHRMPVPKPTDEASMAVYRDLARTPVSTLLMPGVSF